MGDVLNADQRRHLDLAVQQARTAAEKAAADAVHALAVAEPSRPAYLGDDDNALRLVLREKARQLGDDTARGGASLTNLIREVAYEQWHRLLFARFLEANGLLRHPEFRDASLSLDDCAELADELGEPDGWSVAARFAAEILPGVFRLDDPAVQVQFATEHRLDLERILLRLPEDVFVSEDALGWVYQFWQTAEKKRVNESGVKIGGADLSPVTQLFTENYMVRFLLENSLGAWWAARHPDSPLIDTWQYLRRLDDGTPAAGRFEEWPRTAADVTVMDPCCGSGHFLVAMFGMLWRMRAEEEGLSPADAQDAVLRENLHGLELDPRCTQIAAFSLVLEAWKQGGFRPLPPPHLACVGLPSRVPLPEWLELADGDESIRSGMARIHALFLNAETLGSLIDPVRAAEDAGLESVDWGELAPVVAAALGGERQRAFDPVISLLGQSVSDLARSADYLSRKYSLVATNPPFLGLEKQSVLLESFVKAYYDEAKRELALVMLRRSESMLAPGGTIAVVLPSEWMHIRAGRQFRQHILRTNTLKFVALLGTNSFSTPLRVNPLLLVGSLARSADDSVMALDISAIPFVDKSARLRSSSMLVQSQTEWLASVDSRMVLADSLPSSSAARGGTTVGDVADARNGMSAGDGNRFELLFWEVSELGTKWELLQSSPNGDSLFTGRQKLVLWENESGAMARLAESVKHLNHAAQNWRRGKPLWRRDGVVVSQIGARTALYLGDRYDSSCFAIVPNRPQDLPALLAFATSGALKAELAKISPTWKLTSPQTLLQLPFDVEHWRAEASLALPDGIPAPDCDDGSQWLFSGHPDGARQALQVAVARLLAFRWPEQQPDELDRFADQDGIAALQSLPGEPDLATRLRELLAVAYGDRWSSALERALITEAGGKNGRLEEWLRDTFFAQHVKVFDNRPFLWHIWDGRKDGFSAIVNYHRLNHRTLEKLIFTSLGAWIERQKHEAASGRAGADARLAAAEDLQGRLKSILDGVPPYDVYVRWKEMHGQPIGWTPDLDDGVRLNIRPFVTAGVLRSTVNVHWRKDRGTNPDGSERINDLHPTLEERREARRLAGKGS